MLCLFGFVLLKSKQKKKKKKKKKKQELKDQQATLALEALFECATERKDTKAFAAALEDLGQSSHDPHVFETALLAAVQGTDPRLAF